MKKVIIFISLIIVALIGFKINTNASQTFTRSTQTVSFAGADYTILKSPFADLTTINGYNQYIDISSTYVQMGSITSNNLTVSTPVNALGQYKYGNLASLFGNLLINWFDTDIGWVNEFFTPYNLIDGSLEYNYHLVIDYTFASPNDIIVNVDDNGWFQASSNVSKVSLDLYVSMGVYPNYSVNFYLTYYDNNNVVIGSSGAFGGSDTWIGIAFYGISQVDYDNGYQSGYNNGLSDGFVDGYNNGYNGGLDEGYDEGYNDGYISGYDDGTSLSTDVRPMFQTLITFIGSVFSLTIFPGVTIGTLASIPIMFALFKWFMKFFGGK